MKIIINECFGGFGVAGPLEEWEEREKCSCYDERTNPEAIAILEQYGSAACSGQYAELRIVEIPDETTDWEIDEYDGAESITYVVDGRLFHA